MRTLTIVILKSIIALSLAGTIVVLAGILPAVWRDLESSDAPMWANIAFIAIPTAGIISMQVFAVAATLAFALAFLLAPSEMAPGVVGLVGGAGLVLAGFALLVAVMRHLLAQAISYQDEARNLRSELDEVI